MKYTIEGFSQEKLIEFGLDAIDAIILRWLVDFSQTGQMKEKTIKGKRFFWINYQTILDELPILGIKSKDGLSKRINKLIKVHILEKYIDKKAGNFTYFRIIGEHFSLLITSSQSKQEENTYRLKSRKVSDESSEGIGRKFGRVSDESSEGYRTKVRNIYSSTIDSSTNDSSTSIEKENNIKEKVQNPQKNINEFKPDWMADDDWKDLIEHRKKVKAMNTPRALSVLSNELNKASALGWDGKSIVDEIVSRGWKGFKAEWLENSQINRNLGYAERISEANKRAMQEFVEE